MTNGWRKCFTHKKSPPHHQRARKNVCHSLLECGRDEKTSSKSPHLRQGHLASQVLPPQRVVLRLQRTAQLAVQPQPLRRPVAGLRVEVRVLLRLHVPERLQVAPPGQDARRLSPAEGGEGSGVGWGTSRGTPMARGLTGAPSLRCSPPWAQHAPLGVLRVLHRLAPRRRHAGEGGSRTKK